MKEYSAKVPVYTTCSYLFNPDDFPYVYEYVSVYKNVIIGWDEDRDKRVLEFLRNIENDGHLLDLLAIQEHEASIALFWSCAPPDSYRVGDDKDMTDGDIFTIRTSETPMFEVI